MIAIQLGILKYLVFHSENDRKSVVTVVPPTDEPSEEEIKQWKVNQQLKNLK